MNNDIIRTENNDDKKKILYKEFKQNKKINEEIGARQKKVESINMQIKALQMKMSDITFELDILQEIKDSQKTFLAIDKKIDTYLINLKDKDALNKWTNTLSTENESICTKVYSIKNATYTASIIVNHNKKRNFYRVDTELCVSSVLLNLAKEHKLIFNTINDVKIANEGRVLYTELEANEYISQIKDKHGKYFRKEKAPLMDKFKDVDNNKYRAEDFIVYDEMIIDDFEIIEDEYEEQVEEIPF